MNTDKTIYTFGCKGIQFVTQLSEYHNGNHALIVGKAIHGITQSNVLG